MKDYVSKYKLQFKDRATKGFIRAAGAARGLTKTLGRVGIATAAIGAGIAAGSLALANSVSSRADEFAKLSRQVDISAQTLQNLEYISDRQGASFENVSTGVEAFTKRMGELQNETGTLYSTLKKSNPALLKQLKSVDSNEEAFELLVKTLGETESAQEKAALAAAAFSRGAGNDMIRIVDGGADAYRNLTAEAEKFRPPLTPAQLALSEKYQDSITNVKSAFGSLTDIIGTDIMPIIGALADKFSDFIVTNREFIESKSDEMFKRIGEYVSNIDFESLATSAGKLTEQIFQLATDSANLIEKAGGFEALAIAVGGLFAIGVAAPLLSSISSLVLMLGGPMTLSIGAAIAMGVFLYRNWDKIKKKAAELKERLKVIWDWISENLDFIPVVAAAKFLIENWDELKAAALVLKDKLAYAYTSIKEGFSAAFETISEVVTNVWAKIQDTISVGVNFIIDKINFLISQYNKVAGMAGAKFDWLGFEPVDLIDRMDTSGAESAAIGGIAEGSVKVEITGQVDGANVAVNTVSTGIASTEGSNMPVTP